MPIIKIMCGYECPWPRLFSTITCQWKILLREHSIQMPIIFMGNGLPTALLHDNHVGSECSGLYFSISRASEKLLLKEPSIKMPIRYTGNGKSAILSPLSKDQPTMKKFQTSSKLLSPNWYLTQFQPTLIAPASNSNYCLLATCNMAL